MNGTASLRTESKEKLAECEVCASEAARYTCPRCEVRTCSLRCVNIHKKELECSGIRNVTKFVTIDKFTNLDLLSDYRMLEKIKRSVDGWQKIQHGNKRELPVYLHKLRTALLQRGTGIQFLPEGFSSRIRNKTCWNRRTKMVNWYVEWVFPNEANLTVARRGCSELATLASLLRQLLSEPGERLQYYHAVGLTDVALYLHEGHTPTHGYHELDPQHTLNQCLRGKTILEFPRIHVMLRHHAHVYDLLCSNVTDMGNKDLGNQGNVVLAQLLKEEVDENNVTLGPPKNLLFDTRHSDLEASTDDENIV